nr:unnamed protein product [Digitaria exilis]
METRHKDRSHSLLQRLIFAEIRERGRRKSNTQFPFPGMGKSIFLPPLRCFLPLFLWRGASPKRGKKKWKRERGKGRRRGESKKREVGVAAQYASPHLSSSVRDDPHDPVKRLVGLILARSVTGCSSVRVPESCQIDRYVRRHRGGQSGETMDLLSNGFEELCKEDQILVFFERLLEGWRQEQEPGWHGMTAARRLGPLFELSRKKLVPDDIREALLGIVGCCMNRYGQHLELRHFDPEQAVEVVAAGHLEPLQRGGADGEEGVVMVIISLTQTSFKPGRGQEGRAARGQHVCQLAAVHARVAYLEGGQRRRREARTAACGRSWATRGNRRDRLPPPPMMRSAPPPPGHAPSTSPVRGYVVLPESRVGYEYRSPMFEAVWYSERAAGHLEHQTLFSPRKRSAAPSACRTMDLLKRELQKKRKAATQDFAGKSFVRRSELDQKQIQKRRPKASPLAPLASSSLEPAAASGSDPSGGNPSAAAAGDPSTSSSDELGLPRHEVIRRLRLLREPATMFGEGDAARVDRLKHALSVRMISSAPKGTKAFGLDLRSDRGRPILMRYIERGGGHGSNHEVELSTHPTYSKTLYRSRGSTTPSIAVPGQSRPTAQGYGNLYSDRRCPCVELPQRTRYGIHIAIQLLYS